MTLSRVLLAFMENRRDLVAIKNAAIDGMSKEALDAYKQGVRDGLVLAESGAEVSEHDGWTRCDPFIDWGPVRRSVTAYLEVILR